MASIIRIKRSTGVGNPATLAAGELAYSALPETGGNTGMFTGGDRLYIGIGSEFGSNAANHYVIGGKYFTDMLDHQRGLLTNNAALLVDNSGKIDTIKTTNLQFGGVAGDGFDNYIRSTNSNGNIVLSPQGTGDVVIDTAARLLVKDLTVGSVPFVGTDYQLSSDTALTYDATNGKLSVGNLYVSSDVTIDGHVTATIATLGGVVIDQYGVYNEQAANNQIIQNATNGLASGIGLWTAGADNNSVYSSGGIVFKTGATLHSQSYPTGGVDQVTFNANGTVTLSNTSATNSPYSGALTVAGGVGIAGGLNVLGTVTATNVSISGDISTTGTITAGTISSNQIIDSLLTAGQLLFADDTGKLSGSSGLAYNSGTNILTATGEVDIGNITINATANTIGTTTGNLDLNPYGLVQISNAYTLPGTDGATGYYLQTDGMGTVSWAQSSSSLNIAGDGSTSAAINLLTDTLTFVGSNGITAEVSGSNVNFTLSLASDTQQGIASFDATNFTVTAGNVVSNAFTIGNTSLNLGGTTLSLTGLDSVEIDHIKINQNEITYIGTGTGDISIQPLGTGTVAVNNARITGLADPVGPYDAATRNYVDGKVTGLTWKQPVNVLGNTQTSFTGIWPFSIDSHTIQDGYRVLLISQTIATQDGIYTVSTSSGMYSLTRSEDALAYTDLVGAAIFVEEGTRYGNTGWVQSNTYLTDFNNQEWYQFAGAGAYTAGAGLLQDGTTFSVDVNDLTGGLEISANKLQIQHTIAGDGLTYTDGVINVGGTTDRITVTTSAVDIASTYAGQQSITTVGTLTNATWQGDTISTSYGGTGLTTFNQGDILVGTTGSLKALAIGLSGQVLQVNSDGSDLVYADLDGGTY